MSVPFLSIRIRLSVGDQYNRYDSPGAIWAPSVPQGASQSHIEFVDSNKSLIHVFRLLLFSLDNNV
jgi:hypothetical protein